MSCRRAALPPPPGPRRTDGEPRSLLRERDRVEGELVGASGSREEATGALYRLRSATERSSCAGRAPRLLPNGFEPRHPHALSRARAPARGGPARTRTLWPRSSGPASSRGCRRRHVRSPSRASRSCSPRSGSCRRRARRGRRSRLANCSDRGSGPRRAWRCWSERAPRVSATSASSSDGTLPKRRSSRRSSCSRQGAVGHAGGIRVRPCPGELWYAGEAAEAVLLELDARRALVAEIASLEERAERAAAQPVEVRPSSSPRRSSSQASSRQPPGTPPDGAGPARPRRRARRRAPRARRRTARARRSRGELRRRGGSGERASAIDVELATIAAEAKELERRIVEAGADPAEGDDSEELTTKLERLERRARASAASTRWRRRSTSARRSA